MSNIFQGKVELPGIKGSTTINHDARVQLGLTCSEYVLMSHIHYRVSQNRKLTIEDTYINTGFLEAEQGALAHALVAKGFLFPESANPPKITDKWLSGFRTIEIEFEQFWKRKGNVFWPGSKKKALEFYRKVRKEYTKDFLINQRDHYAKFLHYTHLNGFDRDVMMAERWLNPKNEYYMSNWKGEWEKLQPKLEAKGLIKKTPTDAKPLTEEERRKQYAQDSDQ